MAPKQAESFGNGTRYIPASDLASFLAWLVDFLVFALVLATGILVLAGVDLSVNLSGTAVGFGAFGLLFALPLLYGLWYGNGRALGAVLTGTRLVRLSDGGRIGRKGPWAMFIRLVLLPLVFIAIAAGGGVVSGSLKRASIDVARTRQLHAEGASLPPR